jgi:hypothetical protein
MMCDERQGRGELAFKNRLFGALSDVVIRHFDCARWAFDNLGVESKRK